MRLLLPVIVAVLGPTSASAESALDLALKGGPNGATLDEASRTNRYGFTGGLAACLPLILTDRFSLAGQVDLLYTTRGARTVRAGEYSGQTRGHYLDLTLALRPGLRGRTASAYLLLGGGLNFLLRANKENDTGEAVDITDDSSRIDVALLAGAGVAFHFSNRERGTFRPSTIFLEARHDRGLIDTDAVNDAFKNRSTSLMLGLSFALMTRTPKLPPVTSDPAPTTAAGVSE